MAILTVEQYEDRVDSYGRKEPVGLPFKRSLDELCKEDQRIKQMDIEHEANRIMKLYKVGDTIPYMVLAVMLDVSDECLCGVVYRMRKHFAKHGLKMKAKGTKKIYCMMEL